MGKNSSQSQYLTSKINTSVLDYRVYVMTASERLKYVLLLMLAGGIVGLIFYGGLFMKDGKATILTTISNVVVFLLAGLISAKSFIPVISQTLKKKRQNTLKKQICDFDSALTNDLSGGMNMSDSLQAVYSDLRMQYAEDSLIVVEVQEIINGMNNNIPVETMFEDFAQRSGVADIESFATVFTTCYRTGGDLKSVVRRTTDIISEKMMISSEIETAITSNKMQMNIMNVLPIVIVLMMRLMSAQFSESFSSLVGVVGLTITAGLTFASYKMGQKILDIKG